jgi:hypothetical protein
MLLSAENRLENSPINFERDKIGRKDPPILLYDCKREGMSALKSTFARYAKRKTTSYKRMKASLTPESLQNNTKNKPKRSQKNSKNKKQTL